MNENVFWDLIEKLDWDQSGDDEAVLEPVIEELSKMSDEDIFQFEEIMARKLSALDTKAHAKEIGEDSYINEEEYFSPDSFLYARCVVVANGKELFDHILANPTEFPKDMEFEALIYIAKEAYERKNDKEWQYSSPTDYETYKNISGWQ